MNIVSKIMGARWRAPNVKKETTTEVTNGAFAGIVPRIFPTNVQNVFTMLPMGNIGSSGISTRVAARPNSAPMLDSSDWFTQIPGIGILKGMPTKSFGRGTDDVHPAAVSDAEHVSDKFGVHPTIRRKVLRGDGSL